MLELFSILLLVCSLYLVSVGLYSYFAKVSIQEAKQKIFLYLREIFGIAKPEVTYDVFIGLDEGIPNAHVIDSEFEGLGVIFSSYYFANFYFRDGICCYVFSIGPAKKEMETDILSEYTNSICESIVHNYLHNYNPYVGKIRNLVDVDIIDDSIRVYIATTESATNMIATKKANKRLSNKRKELQNSKVVKGSIEV